MYNSVPAENLQQQNTNFAQEFPLSYSPNLAAIYATCKDRGFRGYDRDPRTSYDGQEGHGKMMTACVLEYLKEQGGKLKIFKGCLRLPDGATGDDHDSAKDNLTKKLDWLEKKHHCLIRPIGYWHVEKGGGKHIDYFCYTDHARPKKIAKLFKNAAREVGYTRMAAKPISGRQEIHGAIRYTFKTDARPGKTKDFVHLHIRDGSEAVPWLKRFFKGTSRKAIWDKLKEKACSHKK